MAGSADNPELEKFRAEIREGVRRLERNDQVLFAARCAWRVWPAVLAEADAEWLKQHSQQLKAALAVATLEGLGALPSFGREAASAAHSAVTTAAKSAANEIAATAVTVAAQAAAAVAADIPIPYATSAAYVAFIGSLPAYFMGGKNTAQEFSDALRRTCTDDLRVTRKTPLKNAILWSGLPHEQPYIFMPRAWEYVWYEARDPDEEELEVSQTHGWLADMLEGRPPRDEMAFWLTDWWSKHPGNKRPGTKSPGNKEIRSDMHLHVSGTANLTDADSSGPSASTSASPPADQSAAQPAAPVETPLLESLSSSSPPADQPPGSAAPPSNAGDEAQGYDAYICCSGHDREHAYSWADRLRAGGLQIATYSPSYMGGDEWYRDTIDAISKSKAVLFFASDASFRSSHVFTELTFAAKVGKPFISVFLEPIETPARFQRLISDYPTLGAYHRSHLSVLRDLVEALERVGVPLPPLSWREFRVSAFDEPSGKADDAVIKSSHEQEHTPSTSETTTVTSDAPLLADTTPPPSPSPSPPPAEPEEEIQTHYNFVPSTTITPDREAETLTATAEKCKEALRKFLTSPGTHAPLTVSVEAPWGGGKSSLLRKLQQALEEDGIPTVWFNPWKHEAGKTLWAAFALAFERQMGVHLTWRGRLWRWLLLSLQRLTVAERWLLGVRIVLWLVAMGALGWLLCHGSHLDNAAKDSKDPSISRLLFQGVPWLGVPLLLWAFLQDLMKQVGSPLKLDVARLFTKNVHADGVDDLHRFHEDFSRLMRAYDPAPRKLRRLLRLRTAWSQRGFWHSPAWHPLRIWNDTRYALGRHRGNPRPPVARPWKPGRVVVFIDDLDRCEAPKAADMLQSLHQMLNVQEDRPSDERKKNRHPPGVICVLGMDRDKVAAAIAAKHEKLLPYLLQGDDSARVPRRSAMEFGHEFLEKFIQLTLHLPAMHGHDREEYLSSVTGWRRTKADSSSVAASGSGISPPSASPAGGTQAPSPPPAAPAPEEHAAPGAQARDVPPSGGPNIDDAPPSHTATAPVPVLPAVAEQAAAQRRIRIVDEELSDGHIAWRCAMDVADALENNPRKLKQFVNLFRLRLYLCAAMDVLDQRTLRQECTIFDPDRLSAHHVAKLVALDLACPLKMSETRDQPGNGLLKQVMDCATSSPAIRSLIDLRASESPMYDLKAAPLAKYFQNFIAPAAAVEPTVAMTSEPDHPARVPSRRSRHSGRAVVDGH